MTQRLLYQPLAAAGMRALGSVHLYVASSGLSRELVDLVYLRVSQINGCSYCIATHSRDLLKQGVSAEKLFLLSVWRESGPLFTERERAALQWAEAVTLVAETHVPDQNFDAVRLHYSDKEIADLTIAVGLINAYNRVAISFRQGPEAVSSTAPVIV